LPGLSAISFRAGDFNSFRTALLTPLAGANEQSLSAWKASGNSDPVVADLGVMIAEWWAYVSDVLTFYNERIANENYLRTAALPETPAKLIEILGYRPRPAIAATGTLAALVSPSILPGQTVTLPKGLQFQSKPGPGGAPQTYELAQPTAIGLPDQVSATPAPNLIAQLGSIDTSFLTLVSSVSALLSRGSAMRVQEIYKALTPYHPHSTLQYGVLLKGTVTSLSNGMPLLLGPRDATVAPMLITLSQPPATLSAAGGGKQTLVAFTTSATPPAMSSENARLLTANQSVPLWTVNKGAIDSNGNVHLAGVARQIRPGDWVVFTTSGSDAKLAQVSAAADVMGDASTASGASSTNVTTGTASSPPVPIPVLHTQLTLANGFDAGYLNSNPSAASVLFGWVDAGILIDQPPQPWTGDSDLSVVQPAQFPSGGGPQPILIGDSDGNGIAATGTGSGSSLSVAIPSSTPTPLSPALQSPLEVYFNLLPVTCGKTVASEILGSGNATQTGQSFKLAKSPVTYLATPTGFASTISITVNGLPWTEVTNFYGQPADAQVFVTREDSNQSTWVWFGDGVNGARLTTGTNNVVATYRYGGGASSPPAGKLSVIAQSYPGLQSIANPVAVTGGSDPDPAALLKEYAPRSVLAFGRAVSVFDYQAIAAQAPGVTMASAVWSWDANNQRAGVTVYVAGEEGVASSVQTLLSGAGDPNRPIVTLPATPLAVTYTATFIIAAGMDATDITNAIQAALTDSIVGLFSPPQIAIGQPVFDSQIEASCLAIPGVIAIKTSAFAINGVDDTGPLHDPGEGAYFALDPTSFFPTTEVSGND
jgi:hypothetical protein